MTSGLIRPRPQFASPAVVKPALDRGALAYVGTRATVDSPVMYTKAGLLVAAAVVAYVALVFHARTLVGAGSAAFLLALALVAIGFNVQHDGNHGTFSRRPWVNRIAGFTLDLMGASSYFWKDKHNHNHHVYTNIPHEDADIDIGRMARLSDDHPWLWWHRYQHLYLWALYCCVHLRYLYSDLQRLCFGKKDGLTAAYPAGADMAWLLGGKLFFVTVAFAIPMTVHAPARVIGTYVAVSMVMGLVFSVVFQLAHSVDNVEHPSHGDAHPEWVVHQIATTSNFATSSRVATLLLGGLNYQREHHLFPRIAHVHYPALAVMVQQVCAEHGVRCHDHPSMMDALRSHYRFVRRMGIEPAVPATPTCTGPRP